jgi:hypothetical protein
MSLLLSERGINFLLEVSIYFENEWTQELHFDCLAALRTRRGGK